MKGTHIAVIAVFLAGLGGCDSASRGPEQVAESGSCKVVDYHHGVYYFSCTERKFATALSSFIQANPVIEVAGIASDDTGGYGISVGYFVVTRPKK